MSNENSGKMMRAFAVQSGDEIVFGGVRQTVLRVERPDHRSVLLYTDLTEGKGERPHEIDSRARIELLPAIK